MEKSKVKSLHKSEINNPNPNPKSKPNSNYNMGPSKLHTSPRAQAVYLLTSSDSSK